MGYYFQDDMWEALKTQPLKVRREVVEAICLLFFEGDERELKGVSQSLFTAFKGRVSLSRTRSQAKRKHDADKAAANNEQCDECVGHTSTHKTGTNSDFAIKEGEGEREVETDVSTKPPKPSAAICEQAVAHLNAKTGSQYRPNARKTARLVAARVNEGFTAEDFAAVIDCKAAEWSKDPKMAKFLRPETLFSEKFEGYLNQARLEARRDDRFSKYRD